MLTIASLVILVAALLVLLMAVTLAETVLAYIAIGLGVISAVLLTVEALRLMGYSVALWGLPADGADRSGESTPRTDELGKASVPGASATSPAPTESVEESDTFSPDVPTEYPSRATQQATEENSPLSATDGEVSVEENTPSAGTPPAGTLEPGPADTPSQEDAPDAVDPATPPPTVAPETSPEPSGPASEDSAARSAVGEESVAAEESTAVEEDSEGGARPDPESTGHQGDSQDDQSSGAEDEEDRSGEGSAAGTAAAEAETGDGGDTSQVPETSETTETSSRPEDDARSDGS
ncbi:hypothetical protein FHX37_1900 [Haloactinospora alba]|uniref:Uncharacterized protein n=1 Tax=Haloactinospora alba TaxID=405555 RepID=A0A543NJD4_9ACTN|nr:hypothetical protein [Haloactinospora alba]TQN31975.1 hypothetical protein FHX37_1900 [Haloactinospora alba]